MTAANYITLFRFFLIPVFIGAMLYYNASGQSGVPDEAYRWTAVLAFLIAAISDAVDGYVARAFNQKSALGSVLDPIADKTLILSALIVLSYVRIPGFVHLPLWFLVLVITRAVILGAGALTVYWMLRSVKFKPHWTGKVSTCLLMIVLGAILLKLTWMPFNILIYTTGFFLLLSLMIYAIGGMRIIQSTGYGHAG
ncbi:MAG: CDP-alcohol phosphatidyltransferase family protein [Verrucomicrobiota bacterium]